MARDREATPPGEEATSPVLLSRRSLELFGASLMTAFGAVIIWGATEFDIGWGDRGPGTGYFPFWVGTVVVIGGCGALVEAFLMQGARHQPAVTLAQSRRAFAFLVPLVGFLIATSLLGLYVGMMLYLITVMVVQGDYRLPAALGVSAGTALFFFVVFEKLLKVGLMKGPIEAWLGVH